MGLPRIYTLHAFALSQLVRNRAVMRDLGQPLRIADDWEQRWIIEEDLKRLTDRDLDYVQERFNDLSADWSTLSADEEGWEQRFPDPAFLGAWQEHRKLFGYSLRSELVYQLKRSIDEFGDQFTVDRATHILVDEYQDLNPCDLAIVKHLVSQGSEPYIAGDDDQSIFGFRHAFPRGIRNFPHEFAPSTDRPLTLCKRCDKAVIDIGLFVARQDYARIEKEIVHEAGRDGGEVKILRFADQYREAQGIARIAKHFIDSESFRAHELLVLLRSDHNGAMSKVLREAFSALDIPVVATTGSTPLDSTIGRKTLSVLRLAADLEDQLALRTWLQLATGIGVGTLDRLYNLAKEAEGFTNAVHRVIADPSLVTPRGRQVAETADFALRLARQVASDVAGDQVLPPEAFLDYIVGIAKQVDPESSDHAELVEYLEYLVTTSDLVNLDSFFQTIQSINDDVDNLLQIGKVNIMTMHRAKGLTSPVVIVAGCDDGFIPGRNEAGRHAADERRLLYVSLTRAMHHLYVTYATSRIAQQSHSGRQGSDARRLTRFLRNGPVGPIGGAEFAAGLATAAGVSA